MPDETNVGENPVADEGDLLQTVDQLKKTVEDLASNVSGIYSRSDKDRNNLEKTQEQISGLAESVQALVDLQAQRGTETAPQGGKSEEPKGEEVIENKADESREGTEELEDQVLASMQLPDDDPRVVKLKEEHKGDIAGLVTAATALKVELAKVPPAPTGAETPVTGGQAVITGAYDESAYLKDVQKIMESTRPGDDRIRKLTELKIAARGKGLDKN